MSAPRRFAALLLTALAPAILLAQQPQTITLADALTRARQYGTQIQDATLNSSIAREDTKQARASRLPSVNAFNQYIYTQGDGTPSGAYVANDGVHVYNEQAVIHQELLAPVRKGEVNRALAAEAVAKARSEIAIRGLSLTVIQNYYAIVGAERKARNAQSSLEEARNFQNITEKQAAGGEVARADVVKARISLQQHERDLQDAQLTVEKAKIALGVLIFPVLQTDYAVEDDLAKVPALPALPEAEAKAQATSPDVSAAKFSLEQAGWESSIARYAWVPSFGLDVFYGIDANTFSIHTARPGEDPRNNLGYSVMATLNIPVWNWGSTRSKIKQAEYKQQQAQLDVTLAERTLKANLASAYKEAQTAQAQLESLHSSTDLSSESLRLTILRYQAGEALALEVVDAQTTLTQARNAEEDGRVRYRVAIANLQTLTGNQ